METSSPPSFSVSEFLSIANQTLDFTFASVIIEGEIANFKISKNRWVFFDLKDTESTLNCFIPLAQLHVPVEDGMRFALTGTPKITNFGRFSFTVKALRPLGEGSIKKAFELSRQKLEREGLFAPERKRPLPSDLRQIGVISSINAAGYADFIKILNQRWGGLKLLVANTGVQGEAALPGLLAALDYFNSATEVDLIVILRGGGSADDLQIFNDERLVRKVAASRIPIVSGIGHEIDTTLTDLAADLRAATPSNAAELISRDKKLELLHLQDRISSLTLYLQNYLHTLAETNNSSLNSVQASLGIQLNKVKQDINAKLQTLESLNPEAVLKRGYAILNGAPPEPGSTLQISTYQSLITAKVTHVQKRTHP